MLVTSMRLVGPQGLGSALLLPCGPWGAGVLARRACGRVVVGGGGPWPCPGTHREHPPPRCCFSPLPTPLHPQIFMKYGRQRWKLRGRIEVNSKQVWDSEEMVFLPLVTEFLSIKVQWRSGQGWCGPATPPASWQGCAPGPHLNFTGVGGGCLGGGILAHGMDANRVEKMKHLASPHLLLPLLPQVTELKSLANHVVVGNVSCETKDLFAALPQVVAVDINDLGTLKLSLEVTWK